MREPKLMSRPPTVKICEVATAFCFALCHSLSQRVVDSPGQINALMHLQQNNILGTSCGNKTSRKGPSSQLQCQSAFAMSIHMSLQLTHCARCTKLGELGCFARASCVGQAQVSSRFCTPCFEVQLDRLLNSLTGLCTCSRTCKPKLGTSSKRADVCNLRTQIFNETQKLHFSFF